jgi:type II restriction enzyme
MPSELGWREALATHIRSRWNVGAVFSLTELYLDTAKFTELFPANDHVEDKLRQTLQYLRDDGMLDFLDNEGHYRRLT